MKTIRMALRQYWWAVAVIVVAMVASLVVAGYLLEKQRLPLPWDNVYEVKADFASGQAVTPGQGQAVAVAGVSVGEISDVKLQDGHATVTLRIERDKLPSIRRDATVMLRPRTGLQDMTIELDPGSSKAPALHAGDTIPEAQAISQVQLDEALASLDSDSRAYFQQLLQATAKGFNGNEKVLREILRVGTPTAKQTHAVLSVIGERRAALKGVVTRLGRLSDALVDHDQAVGDTLDRAAVTLKTFAGRDQELKQALALFPSTLRLTGDTLDDAGRFADELGPTSRALRPALRDTTKALPKIEPLLRELPGDLRPVKTLATQGLPAVRNLRATVEALRPQLQDLDDSAKVLQHVVNVLGYDAPGAPKPYSYYLAWFAHNANSIFSTQDAHGVGWRGQLILSCSSFSSDAALGPIAGVLDALGLCK
ncbi:MCE-family protein Mce6D [Patulibacter medicamentivorans]|uniref:MCE-family protein Mce6D n=1 Tax=Patulibacter medicamentivorans TaxID=1097667 RepID=H0EAM9_9ACTN|nr:MlaD family protein [Patulibacter medicamentivorans]EHN09263.1 MCE-family protein Mce6D [Patulibacter medicamentivorans]